MPVAVVRDEREPEPVCEQLCRKERVRLMNPMPPERIKFQRNGVPSPS